MRSRPRPLRRGALLAPFVAAALAFVVAAAARPSPAASALQPAADNPLLDAARRTAATFTDPYARSTGLLSVAETYAAVGLPDMARETVEQAVTAAAASPLRSHIELQAGEACVRAGLYDNAAEVAKRTADRTHAVYLLCFAATAQFQAGLRENAVAMMEKARAVVAAMQHGEPAGRGCVQMAKAYAEAGMEAEFEATLQEALAQAGHVEAPLARSMAVESVATAYLEAGHLDAALRTAEVVPSPQIRIPLICTVAEASATAGDEPQALKALALAGQEAAALPEPHVRAAMQMQTADSYCAAGRTDLARGILRQAERSAARIADPRRGASAWDKLARSYIAAGDMEAAERIIRDGDDAPHRSEQLLNLAFERASRGQYEQAVASLAGVEPGQVRTAGNQKLKALADAYFHVWGADARPKKAQNVQPSELSDAILARYAEAWTAKRDYPEAISFARSVAFVVTRDNALGAVADAALAAADSEQAMAPATEVLSLLQGRLDKLRLRARLSDKQADLGLTDKAEAGLRTLATDATEEEVYATQAEVLGQVAVSYQKLGRTDDARDAAAKAIGAAMKVACASCRDDVLEGLFKLMSGRDYVEVALAAAKQMDLPGLRADNFLRMFEMSRDLAPAQQERLLREALDSAVRTPEVTHRLELLVRAASLYHKANLSVTDAESRLLRESYESIPVVVRPPATAAPEGQAPAPRGPAAVRLVFFDRAGCRLCEQVKDSFDELHAIVPNLTIDTYVMGSSDGADLLNAAICSGLSTPKSQRLVAPSIFSSRGGLIGSEVKLSAMANLAQEARGLPSPVEVFGPRKEEGRSQLAEAYAELGLLVVAGAGLADGIVNPCAFTVIIFFLAYLAHIGKTRREIGLAGIIFTVAVFLTYFGAGLAMVALVGIIGKWSSIASRIIYVATALLALTAAAFSFRDGLRSLKGETGGLTLGLPDSLKSRIRLTISKRARLGLTVGATVLLGAVVAFFELPCTGQTYLPTIMFALRNLNVPVWGPLGWLLVYNLCFIAPLIVIFILVFFGLTSDRMAAFFRRHLASAKFAMSAVFAALFAVMVLFLF
jgi:tetratricopeptide (TPR) repeat protein